jgi:hypothetical protein
VFSVRKHPIITPINEPISQELHLKIQLSSTGLKLSNSKKGCGDSANHFFDVELFHGSDFLYFLFQDHLCFTAGYR